MDSSSYTFTPANQHCVTSTNVTVTSLPGTSTNTTSIGVDSVLGQIAADSRYDTSSKTITKLYGGGEENNNIKFKIVLKKKKLLSMHLMI